MVELAIPAIALEDCGSVIGKRGSGKSNTLMTFFEHELDAKHRAVMIDPKGDRWGYRLTPSKKPSRFADVPVFGGKHGDYPVDSSMGEKLGLLVAEHDVSCLIDLSLLSIGGKQEFMMGFAPVLLTRNKAPLTLFVEEVHQFANQDLKYQPPMLVHHMANFGTLGRTQGVVLWTASQRPAQVNATLRSQSDTIIAHKVVSPLDRDAVSDWLKGAGKAISGRILEEIGSLSKGEAFVWISETGFLERVQFPMATTYDSGRTPKHGEVLDAVKLPKLTNTAIAKLLAPPKVEEPAPAVEAKPGKIPEREVKLQGRISQLENELATARAGTDAAVAAGVRSHRVLSTIRGSFDAIARDATAAMAKIDRELGDKSEAVLLVAPEPPGTGVKMPAEPKTILPPPAPVTVPAEFKMRPALQKAINAIDWWRQAGFDPIDRTRATVIAGLSPKASTFGVYVAELAAAGLVDTSDPGKVALTAAGRALSTQDQIAASTAEIQANAKKVAKLTPAEIKVFDLVASLHPDWVARAELYDPLGLSRTASTLGVYIAKIASFGFIETRPGEVRAADWLFL